MVVFALVFVYMDNDIISSNQVFMTSILSLIIGSLFHYSVTGEVIGEYSAGLIKSAEEFIKIRSEKSACLRVVS